MLLKYDILRNIQLIKLTKRQCNDVIFDSLLNNKLRFSINGKIYNPLGGLEDITNEIMIQYKHKFQYNTSSEAGDIGTLGYTEILEVTDCKTLTIFIDSRNAKFPIHNSENIQ